MSRRDRFTAQRRTAVGLPDHSLMWNRPRDASLAPARPKLRAAFASQSETSSSHDHSISLVGLSALQLVVELSAWLVQEAARIDELD